MLCSGGTAKRRPLLACVSVLAQVVIRTQGTLVRFKCSDRWVQVTTNTRHAFGHLVDQRKA